MSHPRPVEFYFSESTSPYLELSHRDPGHRWVFPFQFLDLLDIERALQAAGLPLEIAHLKQAAVYPASDRQLDILAYWLQETAAVSA